MDAPRADAPQELCNYVLDKLHEDVNRVLTKPYVENFEADGEPDAEIIAEVQKRHRMRNSSRIVRRAAAAAPPKWTDSTN
eukprot:7255138-Prymnesium_polylepis.1